MMTVRLNTTIQQMTVPEGVPKQFEKMLDWLAAEPEDDCLAELAGLRGHLDELRMCALPVNEIFPCLEQLELRALDIAGRFRAQLLGASLPLPKALYDATGGLVSGLQDLVGVLQRVLTSIDEGPNDTKRALEEILIGGRALRLLGEGFVLGGMRGTDPAPGLWRQAFAVLEHLLPYLEQPIAGLQQAAAPATLQFKRMAAISALQPESLTARELAWIHEYLEMVAASAEVANAPLLPEGACFWADPGEDEAPVPYSRRVAPARRGLVFFSAFGMAKRVSEQIDWLERRIAEAEVVGLERDGELLDPDASGLPFGLTPVEVLSLLNRLRERWIAPPSREHSRRPRLYSAQVCVGLRSIWAVHKGLQPKGGIVEWTVCNESPGGYGIVSVSEMHAELVAGMVLGLRRDASEAWSICLVRWIRSNEAEQIELGLQVVGSTCTPVSIGFRGGELRSTTSALLLPPLPGVRNNVAILAPAGTYTSRRFVLVREGQHVYIAQGRVLGLDLQTASVELFQYEIDPFPI